MMKADCGIVGLSFPKTSPLIRLTNPSRSSPAMTRAAQHVCCRAIANVVAHDAIDDLSRPSGDVASSHNVGDHASA